MTGSAGAIQELPGPDTETRPVSRAELLMRYVKQLEKKNVADRHGSASNQGEQGRDTLAISGQQHHVGEHIDKPEQLHRLDVALRPVSFKPVDRPSFRAIQEWEGYVIHVGDSTFLARLTDLSVGARRAEEEVELLVSDLSDDDKSILAVGSMFRWAIGYQRSPGGSRKRVSQIVFRRLPQWTRKELDQASEEGAEMIEAIQWD